MEILEFAPDAAERSDFDALAPGARPEPVRPAARCMLAAEGARPLARLTREVVPALHGVPGPVGLVGHYEAADDDAGVALLRSAADRLRGEDAAMLLGPMNGSTWARYRLVTDRAPDGGPVEPPFLTEPWNPPGYPLHFERAGFRIAAEYESRIAPATAAEHPNADELARAVERAGIETRPLDPDRYDEALAEIFRLSTEAFAENLFYSPIDWSTFRTMYEPVRPLIDPDLVRLAYGPDGALAGFVFALPDALGARSRPTRAIIKTLATAPAARGIGLGSHLVNEVHGLVRQKGYAAVIHALMHVENRSVRISRHSGTVMRGYGVYRG